MEILSFLLVLLVVGGMAMMAATLVAKNLIYICGPNEVLVFSGRGSKDSRGRDIGYRIIKGGRGFRIPLIETVDRMDLTNITIEVVVTNAYSKGGIPLTVQGVANVKVAGHEPAISNAIERFLGRERKEIVKVAKDTLEGNLRGVLSQLTPEEVNEDKIAFGEKLLEEAEHDLGKLGLTLDTLKIQNVSDEVKYLDSIGRKRSAEVVKHARIAEADAHALSVQQEAGNVLKARRAAINSEMTVIRAQTNKRIRDSETRLDAMVAEERGQVKALIAAAQSDFKVQEARVEQVRRQLLADVVAPAQAEMEAARSKAKGDAARILEDGRATATVLREMTATWRRGGDHARDIFLMQKMQSLMGSLVGTIDRISIDKITVLPQALDGDQTPAMKAVRLVEEMKGALGVDIPRLIEQAASGRAAPAARPEPGKK